MFIFYDNANNPELEEQYPDMSDEERAKQISENYGVPFSIFLAPEKMREIEDLSAEGNKTIRVIERENGQKAYLRFYFHGGWKESPGEAEISGRVQAVGVGSPHDRFPCRTWRTEYLPGGGSGIQADFQ